MTALAANKLVKVNGIISEVYGDALHKKRQLSMGLAAMGLLASETLFIHRIAEGLVNTRGGSKKHATKQIDRLLSNKGVSVWDLSDPWVKYVVGEQKDIMVVLDWTSFAHDKQSTLGLNLLTAKGISTPLLWKTVENKHLKSNRARYEDQLLSRLKAVVPTGVKVTVVADRGFADQKFFQFLNEELQFDYIIRIKSNTTITHRGESKKAVDYLRADGRALCLAEASITLKHYAVKQFVAVRDKGMKAAWYLVSNTQRKTKEIINCYARRWKIEPYFRDLKDGRFGFGMQETHIKSSERRDRLLLVLALSYLLLIILGQAGEALGFDKKLKVNTVKTRTHSLFRQGQFYYEFFFRFTEEEQESLIHEFGKILAQHAFWCDFFGVLK